MKGGNRVHSCGANAVSRMYFLVQSLDDGAFAMDAENQG
jgi:hypothetical protein